MEQEDGVGFSNLTTSFWSTRLTMAFVKTVPCLWHSNTNSSVHPRFDLWCLHNSLGMYQLFVSDTKPFLSFLEGVTGRCLVSQHLLSSGSAGLISDSHEPFGSRSLVGIFYMTIRVARGIHPQQVCISLVLESAPSGQLTQV